MTMTTPSITTATAILLSILLSSSIVNATNTELQHDDNLQPNPANNNNNNNKIHSNHRSLEVIIDDTSQDVVIPNPQYGRRHQQRRTLLAHKHHTLHSFDDGQYSHPSLDDNNEKTKLGPNGWPSNSHKEATNHKHHNHNEKNEKHHEHLVIHNHGTKQEETRRHLTTTIVNVGDNSVDILDVADSWLSSFNNNNNRELQTTCPGQITFIDLSAPNPGNGNQALILNYQIGSACGYSVELFENDCVTAVTDIDISELDAVESDVGGDLTNVKLEYSIPKENIEQSNLWSGSQVELCIAFTILDSPNGNPMSQEKRQVFIEWEDIVNNGGGGNGGGGTCDGVINFVDLTTAVTDGKTDFSFEYDIGNTCGYTATIFYGPECDQPVTDVTITAEDPQEVDDGNGNTNIILGYSFLNDGIETTSIWDATSEEVKLCLAFTIEDENGIATSTEKRQFAISYSTSTSIPTRPPITQTPPVNDVCVNSIDMGSLPYTASGTTQAATAEIGITTSLCGADATANGVWYSYTSPIDQIITSNVNAGQVLRIYSGTCTSLVCLNEISSTQDFFSEAGSTYYFLVSKESFSVGSAFTISASAFNVPTNDDCLDAITVGALPFDVSGSTEGATPDFNDSSTNGVWYTYTPAMNGVYTASVDGNKIVTVYSGSCSALASVSSGSGSSSSFSGQSGSQYWMYISESEFSTGSEFTFSMRQDGGGPVPATPFPTFSKATDAPTIDPDVPPPPAPKEPTFSPTVTPTISDDDIVVTPPTLKPVSPPTTFRPTEMVNPPFVICTVCSNGITVPPSTPVGQGGKTCGTLLEDRMDVEEGSAECANMKNAEPTCCPSGVVVTPRPTPAYISQPPYAWGGGGSPPTPPPYAWGGTSDDHPSTDNGWGWHACSSKSSKSKASKMFKWNEKWSRSSWDNYSNPPPPKTSWSSSSWWSKSSKSSKSKSSKCYHGKAAKAKSDKSWHPAGWTVQGKTPKGDWNGDRGDYWNYHPIDMAWSTSQIQKLQALPKPNDALGMRYRIQELPNDASRVGGRRWLPLVAIVAGVVGVSSWLI